MANSKHHISRVARKVVRGPKYELQFDGAWDAYDSAVMYGKVSPVDSDAHGVQLTAAPGGTMDAPPYISLTGAAWDASDRKLGWTESHDVLLIEYAGQFDTQQLNATLA